MRGSLLVDLGVASLHCGEHLGIGEEGLMTPTALVLLETRQDVGGNEKIEKMGKHWEMWLGEVWKGAEVWLKKMGKFGKMWGWWRMWLGEMGVCGEMQDVGGEKM